MKISISWPTSDEWKAVGRHAVTFAAGGLTFATGVIGFGVATHVLSPDQASQLTGAFTNISHGVSVVVNAVGVLWNGVTQIAGGFGVLASIGMAWWASRSSTPKANIEKAAAQPGTTVVTTAAMANSIPASNVVSNTENKVVSAKGA